MTDVSYPECYRRWPQAHEKARSWDVPDCGQDENGAMAVLRCACGGTSFEIFFPRFVLTCARCKSCGQEAAIHDG